MATESEGEMNDRLSALVDGELDHMELAPVVERLLEDSDMRARWARYHLLRAYLRGFRPCSLGDDLSARIRAALANES